jgi:hypothetical protein
MAPSSQRLEPPQNPGRFTGYSEINVEHVAAIKVFLRTHEHGFESGNVVV